MATVELRAESSSRDRLVLAALFLAAAWLRFDGVTFGLPFLYHFDERLYVLTAQDPSLTRLHPVFGPYQILLAAGRWLVQSARPVLDGLIQSDALRATLESPKLTTHLFGRWLSAALGALTVFPAYWIGREVWSRGVGLLASTFTAVAFIHVRSSHYSVPDTATTLLVTLTAFYCCRLFATRATRHYVLAGLTAGLALPCKQLSWPTFVMILAFHLAALHPWRGEGPEAARPAAPAWRRWVSALFGPRLVAAYATGAAAFLLTSPQVVLRTSAVLDYWRWGRQIGAKGGLGRVLIDSGVPWKVYLDGLHWGLGTLLLAAVAAGVVAVVVRRRPLRGALLMLYPVLLLGFLLIPGNMYFQRYYLTAVPLLLLPAAALVLEATRRLPGPRGVRVGALAASTVLLIAQPLWSSLVHNRLLGREDTRTLAKRWIEQNVPDGTHIIVESLTFGPHLSSQQRTIPLSTRTYQVGTKGPYGLSERSNSAGPTKGVPSVEEYAATGAEYIVTSSFIWESPMIAPEEDRAKRGFYEALDTEAELVWEISPTEDGPPIPWRFTQNYGPATDLSRLARPGPAIKIYRLRPDGGQPDSRTAP